MVNHGITTLFRTATPFQQRISTLISNLTVRLLIAFALSWLIILIFFVSGAISH